jgi:NACalpha-BTF3-like transcription factor
VLVLGSHTRLFKDVFNRANTELMDVFGMQMVELPKAERVTMRQKRSMPMPLTQPQCLMSSSCRCIRYTEQVERFMDSPNDPS